MTKYNGHKNWTYWNVSLWLANDEGLYNLARSYVRRVRRGRYTRQDAARDLVSDLHDMGADKTPDGARYSVSAVRAALSGLE